MGLLDLIRRPKVAKKTDFKSMFVPVIFATGQDDDLPGLVAALKNEAVQYGDKIYKPDEDITIHGHRDGNGALCLSCNSLYVIGPNGSRPRTGDADEPGTVVVRQPAGMCRFITITDNLFIMNWRPR